MHFAVLRRDAKRVSGGAVLSRRIAGIDLARALAVIGMVIVNFSIVLQAEGGTGWLAWCVHRLEGRASAMFVILAGVGLSLLSQRARESGDADALRVARNIVLKRALFFLVLGLSFATIWPADILHFYGLYLLVGALMLGARDVTLLGSAAAVTLGFVVLLAVFDYDAGWNFSTLHYAGFWSVAGMVRHMLFNGFHPLVPWSAFLLVGMWLGRLDLRKQSVQSRLFVGALLVAVATEWASSWAVAAATDLVGTELTEALVGTQAMPPMPTYVVAAGATAVAVIALCIKAGQLAPRVLGPLIATGQLSLTLYLAHIIDGLGALLLFGLLSPQSLPFAVGASLSFCVLAIITSHVWRRHFSAGPLEWLLRRATG